jgi:hypothetical protein
MKLQTASTPFQTSFFYGFERIALNYIWRGYFGRMALGSIKGSAMTVTVLGSALGPLPFVFAFDLFGGLTIFFPLAGIVCSLLAKKPEKDKVVIK